MPRKVKFGVFVGRLNPVHLGHEQVIQRMLADWGPDHCLLVLCRAAGPTSLRHFFAYETRRHFVKTLFPSLRIVDLHDFDSDPEWLLALDDLIRLAGADPSQVQFYGGSDEDVRFFLDDGRHVVITNRFDGSSPKISATEVRDALIHRRSLDGLVNPAIEPELRAQFDQQWEEFKRR
ncbi:MAG TPA: hypothetical protein VLF67_01475 [Candidatus Saccharimonas sp.]|nr:hypothetical protein [Candidatus Saccharimonas sp.]